MDHILFSETEWKRHRKKRNHKMDAFGTLTANVSAYCIMAAFETIKKSEIASAYWKLLFLYYTFDCYDIRLATCGWTILALEKVHVVLRDAAEAMEVDKPATAPTISFERPTWLRWRKNANTQTGDHQPTDAAQKNSGS